MWDGKITAAATRPARLHGFQRRYWLWDERERGTAAHRALTLGLEPGGLCDGLAMRIASLGWRMRMKKAWAHEMAAGFYTALWVPVVTAGGPVTALTFVADPVHPLFAGTVPDTAALLASARGQGGTAAEYLGRTTATLHRLGTPDPYLTALLRPPRPGVMAAGGGRSGQAKNGDPIARLASIVPAASNTRVV